MLHPPPNGFQTNAVVVAYDLNQVINCLDVSCRPYYKEFVNFILHQYRDHTVDQFLPTSLGPMVNQFERQRRAIQTLYWQLSHPLDCHGEHVITKFVGNAMWIVYLEHYYQ